MQVLGDAIAFVDDGQALELLVEAGVLHRDPGMQGEGLDERPILLAELVRSGLVGQVQPAQGDALDRDRDAQEARHRRVVRRKPEAARIGVDVGDPERAVLADDQPQQAVALGQGADRLSGRIVHAARDEALDPAIRVDDPERGVVGADERTHAVDDDLQDVVDGGQAGDLADGRIEGGMNLAKAVG